jgi:uncharacterized protein (TIGR00251 family)
VRIRVVVKPNARENRVERVGDDEYFVLVKAAPKQGRANAVLLKVLSKHFGGQARILAGFTRRHKVIEIETRPPPSF